MINLAFMETLKIDRTKLYTQSEYARKIGKDRSTVNKMAKSGQLKTVTIRGAILIYEE